VEREIPGRLEALAIAERTGSPTDADRWRDIVSRQGQASLRLRQQLVEDGWTDEGGDGLVRYVHVDDLEKIEGPPPEGAF
jgi:hypothetical protein